MAKRYHQSREDRMHESRGMRERMGEGHYSGHEARRYEEMRDGGMIHEDHTQIANFPQEVMMKPYPKETDYMPEDLDDTIRGIDEQMGADNRKRKEHFRPHKY